SRLNPMPKSRCSSMLKTACRTLSEVGRTLKSLGGTRIRPPNFPAVMRIGATLTIEFGQWDRASMARNPPSRPCEGGGGALFYRPAREYRFPHEPMVWQAFRASAGGDSPNGGACPIGGAAGR